MEYKHCQGRTQYETKDCVVRSLTVAANIEYRSAWFVLNDAGRKPKHATAFDIWIEVFQKYGLCLDKDLISRPPYPMNNVIVMTKHHLYAIRDMKHSDIGHKQMLDPVSSVPHLYRPKLVIKCWAIPVSESSNPCHA